MMNQDLFTEVVKEKIKDFLPEHFQDYSVELHTVNKVNGDKLGITLRAADAVTQSVTPTIYVDDMYEEYKKSENLEAVLMKASMNFVSEFDRGKEMIAAMDLNNMKDNVVMMLVNTEQNKEMLQSVPHREFEDLSIIYRWVVSTDQKGIASTIVSEDLMRQKGMTEPDLFMAAVANTKEMMPPKVVPMTDIIKGIMMEDGMPEEIVNEMLCSIPDEDVMWVITNERGINGAVNMIYEENLRMISQHLNDDLYVLPSSIHETIAIPASMGEPEELAKLVYEVNMGAVQLSERLSNEVYHYDKETRRLSLATDSPNKRLDGAVNEIPMIYEDKKESR